MIKTTLAVYLNFGKLIFFESMIIFLEPKIKLITRLFGTGVFFDVFVDKDPHLNAVETLESMANLFDVSTRHVNFVKI